MMYNPIHLKNDQNIKELNLRCYTTMISH
jgi:hypothetical protein